MSASMDKNMFEDQHPKETTDRDAIEEEEKRIRKLRRLVDFSFALIAQSNLSLPQAQRMVQTVREEALELFPGKEETFNLIYGPRFRRLIAEKYRLQ